MLTNNNCIQKKKKNEAVIVNWVYYLLERICAYHLLNYSVFSNHLDSSDAFTVISKHMVLTAAFSCLYSSLVEYFIPLGIAVMYLK